MAKNFVQTGNELTLLAPYQRNPGEGALVGSIFGVSLGTVANGIAGEFAIEGVWDLAKVNAQAWAAGDKIYWDDAAKNATTAAAAGANKQIGVATQVAANPTLIGRVRLTAAFTI